MTTTLSYQCHRFSSEIISHAIWLYHRLCVSFREVEALFAERGVTVGYETIRQWGQKVRHPICIRDAVTA